ncbi:MAG: biotin/lipoyl-containing protein [Candidatus Flexifilum sp.]
MFTGHYRIDDRVYTAMLTRLDDGRFRLTVGEQTLTFTAIPDGPGRWRIATGESAHTVSVGAAAAQRHVVIDGEAVIVTRTGAPRVRHPGGVDPDPTHRIVTAPMPGQVRAVLIQPGDAVHVGQTLIVLEAMKMELRVTAPVDGQVTAIHVEAGQNVARGQRLADLA